MTGLAIIPDSASESDVMVWCEQGLTAIEAAADVVDAKGLLDIASTLTHAIRLRDMNSDAIIAASRLKAQAARRVGELLAVERANGRLVSNGGDRKSHLRSISLDHNETDPVAAKLADHGITYDEAATYTKLAAVPAEVFEDVLDAVAESAADRKVGITTAAILRAVNSEAEKRPDQRAEDFEKFIDACERALDRATAAYNTVLFRQHTTEANPWPEATVNHATRITGQLVEAIRKIDKELLR